MFFAKIIGGILITTLVIWGVWSYYLSIYEIRYSKTFIKTESGYTVFIKAYPVNGLGLKVPFRKADSEYKIYNKNSGATLRQLSSNEAKLQINENIKQVIIKAVSEKYQISELITIETGVSKDD